ncbi:MAG: hypothetical protein FJX22_04135 [Alphaproteobacteria bacterium]|nr:hypothetical protein [Alphaproteobacteria bacterium]
MGIMFIRVQYRRRRAMARPAAPFFDRAPFLPAGGGIDGLGVGGYGNGTYSRFNLEITSM